MKLLKLFGLILGISILSACGDGLAPPEVERAVRESHSAKSRQKQMTTDANASTEQATSKKGKAKAGNTGDSSSGTPQFMIIPGGATKTE
jgi:hypothetical protein